jgi:hypothetical protein
MKDVAHRCLSALNFAHDPDRAALLTGHPVFEER